jgi:hypothetical protein
MLSAATVQNCPEMEATMNRKMTILYARFSKGVTYWEKAILSAIRNVC